MSPAQLINAIHQIDRQMEGSRQRMADLAVRRQDAVSALVRSVGGTEAARLLGISRTAVYRAAKGRGQ